MPLLHGLKSKLIVEIRQTFTVFTAEKNIFHVIFFWVKPKLEESIVSRNLWLVWKE